METLAEQPLQVEALDRYTRVYNDASTWLAEVLDGPMRTPFEYRFDGQELYAEDGGALGGIFEDALTDAERLAAENPHLSFELRRRTHEAAEYQDMLAMMRGELPNTMVVVSDFPAELMTAQEDVGGYNVSRKQTFLRVLTRQGSRLKMYSQTLDGSDRKALEAIYASLGQRPEAGELLGQRLTIEIDEAEQPELTDRLMNVYDASLQHRHGGNWYAGRKQQIAENTYSFVQQQHTLVDRLACKTLDGSLSSSELYNAAALLTKRFEASRYDPSELAVQPARLVLDHFAHHLEHELAAAGAAARKSGKTFSGCGASAGPENLSASDSLEASGYGNEAEKTSDDEDKYGPLTFKCKNGHTNRRPRGRLLNSCRVVSCKNSVAC